MEQCVCGQYYNPGDVQCRFCGRLLQDSSYAAPVQAGYDQFMSYQKLPEYDAGYAQKPYLPETKAPQPGQAYDLPQRPYPQGQPFPYQPAPALQQAAPPLPPRLGEPKPAPKQAPASARDVTLSPDLVAAIRALKSRSLVQLIVIISGFVLSIGTSVYLIIVLSAILRALS